MSEDKSEGMRAIHDAVVAKWAAEGKIIEGGYWGMVKVMKLENAPAHQMRDMRLAYWLGAQHLFASIMSDSVLDPASPEATEADMNRFNLIAAELQKFAEDQRSQQRKP
jgi:hypothetical protein